MNILALLKELTYKGEVRPELIIFHRHWIDGDDGIVLMPPCRLPTKCNTASSRAILAMIDPKIGHEERPGVDWEVGHGGLADERRLDLSGGRCCRVGVYVGELRGRVRKLGRRGGM